MSRPLPVSLNGILKGTSRSFYLTLRVAPGPVRRQLGAAYLFCRAADTIADTSLIPPRRRVSLLEVYRSQFEREEPDPAASRALSAELTGLSPVPGERNLLSNLDGLFRVYLAFEAGDRALIRRLVATLTLGMAMDLESFPLASAAAAGEGAAPAVDPPPRALAADADLDRYCYHVAGCVGEFWTDLASAHLPALAHWDLEDQRKKGVRFGKGLQMTNVLRDIPRDLRIGRCYVPRSRLAAAGLEAEDLRGGGRADRPLPGGLGGIIDDLLDLTLDHYRAGWEYTLSIPARAPRLRLACAWPLLIGLETLALLRSRKGDLLRGENLKIPRVRIWRMLAGSTASALSSRTLDRLYRRRERAAMRTS
jgi:farnesyl-diphosphate farnesyltransferase